MKDELKFVTKIHPIHVILERRLKFTDRIRYLFNLNKFRVEGYFNPSRGIRVSLNAHTISFFGLGHNEEQIINRISNTIQHEYLHKSIFEILEYKRRPKEEHIVDSISY